VERAIDLEDDDAPARQAPLAVGVPDHAELVTAFDLSIRERQSEPTAHTSDVDLSHRLSAAVNVDQRRAQ